MSKKCSKLEEIKVMFEGININFEEIDDIVTTDIVTIIKKQKDTRYQPNVKHKMEDILLITLFAILAKCNEWTEIEAFATKKETWLRNIIELPNGIPSHDTIQRVISILNPETLYSDTINYLIEKIDALMEENDEKDILSMDGKTSNGSARSEESQSKTKPVNTMSVFSSKY